MMQALRKLSGSSPSSNRVPSPEPGPSSSEATCQAPREVLYQNYLIYWVSSIRLISPVSNAKLREAR